MARVHGDPTVRKGIRRSVRMLPSAAQTKGDAGRSAAERGSPDRRLRAGPAGSVRPALPDSAHACRSWSSSRCGGPGVPGSSGCRSRPPGGGWQECRRVWHEALWVSPAMRAASLMARCTADGCRGHRDPVPSSLPPSHRQLTPQSPRRPSPTHPPAPRAEHPRPRSARRTLPGPGREPAQPGPVVP